ncbi:MAG: hypothetical protein ACC618_03635 [Patescibacteria group bacterium]
MSTTVFTNKILKKMANFGLSESQVIDAFNKGEVEKWKGLLVSVKKYSGYELRVFWKQSPEGKFILLSVNKRKRR